MASPRPTSRGCWRSTPRPCASTTRDELDLGATKANAQVAGFLFAAAKGGNVTAQIFWLKTRARWKEPPAEFKHAALIGNLDLSKLSDQELSRMVIEAARDVLDEAAPGGGEPA